MMMVEEKPEYMITTEKLEELKENIPRAGPKYRLGMYFETIHNLPCFDDISSHHDDTGYTSYWETDTEVDSDFGNFLFNNVSGDSASVICIDDAVDLIRRKQQEEILSKKPHYKLDHGASPATSPSTDHPLEMSLESKQSGNSQYSRMSHHTGMNEMFNTPPPVPPPRRATTTATPTDLQDHTYETLDDCKGEYLSHHQEIYFSKSSDDSRGSQDSSAKPVSNDEAEYNHLSHCKGAEGTSKSPKPRSHSLQLAKSPDCCEGYRQRRKMSEPTSQNSRKRRLEKVASKGFSYPPPVKGFPAGVPEEYVDYLTASVCLSADRQSPMCTPPSPVTSPSQRVGFVETPEKKNREHKTNKAAPLVIKHKGKTYLVPVVDKKLQKELEKKSRAENPSVTIKHGNLGTTAVSRSSSNASNVPRSFASPPKVDPTDYAASHRRRSSTKVLSSPQKVPKQVTHYGVF